ncbi:MAG: aminodeoxychorismate/anthranilate synthase component II [Prolixibacteraceae bacterium]|nr:aminodeoxychorismate/anthranilate synthase component II [Prolixibacteraceae bacterium]
MTTKQKIMVLDNYDSFTYNLVHAIKELTGGPVDVFRNDEIPIAAIGKYDKIVLSPGPGIPDEAGILKELIATYGPTKSIFGVCLGCQAIAEVYGGKLLNMNKVYHGVSTPVTVIDKNDISFAGLPQVFEAGRYHSWIVDSQSIPASLKVSSVDAEGNVMALYHREYDVRGVQFHPESVLTPKGYEIIANFLNN